MKPSASGWQPALPQPKETQRLMHTTMQSLGRVATIAGGIAVALLNILVFADADRLGRTAKTVLYAEVYEWALAIPLISVLGVLLATLLRRRARRRLMAQGMSVEAAQRQLDGRMEPTRPNYWILGGSLAFIALSLLMGFSFFALTSV